LKVTDPYLEIHVSEDGFDRSLLMISLHVRPVLKMLRYLMKIIPGTSMPFSFKLCAKIRWPPLWSMNVEQAGTKPGRAR